MGGERERGEREEDKVCVEEEEVLVVQNEQEAGQQREPESGSVSRVFLFILSAREKEE